MFRNLTQQINAPLLKYCSFFRRLGNGVGKVGLGHFEDTESPIMLAALGGLCVSVIAVLVPPTMFWAELEMETIASPGKDLPHIWPQVVSHSHLANALLAMVDC